MNSTTATITDANNTTRRTLQVWLYAVMRPFIGFRRDLLRQVWNVSDCFETIAGRNDGLRRIMLAAGQLGPSEGGPLHPHHGEEILHILSGEVEVTVGSETRRCAAGDVVIIPTDTLHRFTTITETTMEVVAELDAGQIFPVQDVDGTSRLVEVYRSDLPWSRQPPSGFDWTSDEEMAEVLRRASSAESPR